MPWMDLLEWPDSSGEDDHGRDPKLGGTFSNPKINGKTLDKLSKAEIKSAHDHYASKSSLNPSEKFVLSKLKAKL